MTSETAEPTATSGSASSKPAPARDSHAPRRGRLTIAAGTALVITAGGWFAASGSFVPPERSIEASPAAGRPRLAQSPGSLVADARLVPVLERITISAPKFAAGARIAHVEARVGETLAKGDLLVVLDSRDALVAEMASAVSTADARAADFAAAQARAQGRIENAREGQSRIEARARAPRQQLARMQRLRERRVITAADLDRAVAAHDRALRETRNAASAVQTLVEGTDPEVEFAQLELDAAMAALTQAELRVNDALVLSPRAGRVVAVMASTGDELAGQPLLEVAAEAGLKAAFLLPPQQARRASVGHRVTLERQGSIALVGAVTKVLAGDDGFTIEAGIDTPLPIAAQQLPAEGWTAEIDTGPGS